MQVNPNASTIASGVRGFTVINVPTFFGFKVEENPQGLIDEVLNVLDAMDMTSQEKVELAAHQFNYVAQVLNEQCKDDRPVR